MTAAALIDSLLCPHCGRSPLPPERPIDAVCICHPPRPVELAAEVRTRHFASVCLAREHDRDRALRSAAKAAR